MPEIRMPRFCLVVIALLLCCAAARADAAANGSCDAPAYRQFDFWVGDWDAFEVGAQDKPPVARTHVDRMLGDCVLREDYVQNDGLHGRSFTIYDAHRKLWHQSWVTNRGDMLVIEGRLQGRRIVLEGDQATADGRRRIRATWEPQGDGVRETAVVSTDGGHEWKPLFDIVFRPHAR
jgi:hypothetical protein